MASKSDLVEVVYKNIVKKHKDAKKVCAEGAVNSVLAGMTEIIQKKKSLLLVGFGSFAVKARKARKGRNPQTGKPITIKASRVVRFKASKELKKGL